MMEMCNFCGKPFTPSTCQGHLTVTGNIIDHCSVCVATGECHHEPAKFTCDGPGDILVNGYKLSDTSI